MTSDQWSIDHAWTELGSIQHLLKKSYIQMQLPLQDKYRAK